MRLFKVRRVASALLIVAAVFLFLKYRTRVESERMWIPDHRPSLQQPPERRVRKDVLMRDVAALSSDDFEGRETGTRGGLKAREWVAARLRECGVKPAGNDYFEPFSFVHYSLRGLLFHSRRWRTEHRDAANVVGMIDGARDRSLVLVLSAHYDHVGIIDGEIYNGADDNASGVAVLLAAASWFHSHPPDHSILFAAFDAEETGLDGSAAFMKHPPVDRARLGMNINMDMVSRCDYNRIFVSGTYPFPFLKPIVDTAAARSPVTVLYGHDRPMYMAGFVESWIDESDQSEFYEAGIPFLYFGVEDHEDYHEPTDDAGKINPTYFLNAAELILDTIVAADHGLAHIHSEAR